MAAELAGIIKNIVDFYAWFFIYINMSHSLTS